MADPLLDSSILIDCLRGRAEAIAYIVDLRSRGRVLVPTPAVAEVLAGARNAREMAAVRRYLAQFEVVLSTPEDIARSLDLLVRRRLSHGVGWLDCLIAATGLRLSVPIATTNDKHFRAFTGLDVVRPY